MTMTCYHVDAQIQKEWGKEGNAFIFVINNGMYTKTLLEKIPRQGITR